MTLRTYRSLILPLLVAVAIAITSCQANTPTNAGKLSFSHPLNIPPLLKPTIDSNGHKYFKLSMQSGYTEFMPGKRTATWGINGAYLGPTIRASRGDRVTVEVVNQLKEPSTLHWHGMRLPAVMDGGPHQMINAGAAWSPNWIIDQPAATTWYHPHLHGFTAKHVYRGLAGLFLIDDAASKGLPSNYGADDIPLIIQDKQFTEDGSLTLEPATSFGLLGDQILVNGTYDPFVQVTSAQVRFRLLNASNARAYNFGFNDGRSFTVVANDAGLLPNPIVQSRVTLSPGERMEILVDFKPGEETILHSFSGSNGLDNGEFDILKIIASDKLTEARPLPQPLAAEPEIDAPEDATIRRFHLTGASKINGKAMDMYRIDEVVAAGSREIWEITNTGFAHNFHIHDAAFRILDINGQEPPAYESGRKDTVFIPSGALVRLAVDFGTHPNPDHPYMFHCHILLHEDEGMMGQFVIVKPGTESQVSRRLPVIGGTKQHGGAH